MTSQDREYYESLLESLVDRTRAVANSVADQVRNGSGGQAMGELSNAPMHLADGGSMEYLHDLNAVLLENEERLAAESEAALRRLRHGRYGVCERCESDIAAARLEALPYTRWCVNCAAAVNAGFEANLDQGRARLEDRLMPQEDEGEASEGRLDDVSPDEEGDGPNDVHAAGTAGGGTGIGGLAGTNVGNGDPDEAQLQSATANGNFDAAEATTTETGSPRRRNRGEKRGPRAVKRVSGEV